MCAGAMVLARLPKLVYATTDPKAGASGSLLDITQHPGLNHRVDVAGGLFRDEAAEQIRAFFRMLRARGEK
jgi:tRNA(adenine34) deaminase